MCWDLAWRYAKSQQTSVKIQGVNFVHIICSVATAQFCHYSSKAAKWNTHVKRYVCIPIKLYLKKKPKAWFDSLASVCQPWLSEHREESNARNLEFWPIISLKITMPLQVSPRRRVQSDHKFCDDVELALDIHGGLVWRH